MFKCIVYIGYGRDGPYIDMWQCVPWPDITDEAMQATRELTGKKDPAILREMGYPEAAQLLHDAVGMDLRSRYAELDKCIIDLDFKPSREEMLGIAMLDITRREK